MNIREWHERLYTHFTALHEERLSSDYSVFAFEHGLDDDRREELKRSVCEHLTRVSPDERYWLPWVVYSAEIGYEFDGREYWHTFEDKTPGWRVKGNRNFVRDGFKQFVQSFNGFKPSGAWANHRTIISYPITHAILPKDFQSRLLEILKTLRPYLRTLIQSPRLLGKKIAEHSYYEPERFQQFAQNNELIGLIAREILTVDEKGSEKAILNSTFRRIISDIRKEEAAAAALDEARSFIKGKSIIRGKNRRALKPQLVLRRIENRNWDVFVELPDLLPLAEKSQAAEDFLQSARPKITGCLTEKRLATGLLVNHGATLRQLRAVPKNSEQLVNFRRELPKELEDFFKKAFVFDLPALTVFSAQTDGLAPLHESNVVRPESNYIVMSREEVNGNAIIKPLETSCGNVFLYSLSSESLTDKDNRSLLQKLGLEVETDFRLVPVGLPPTKWDGDSKIEYLDGEAPTFALKLDLPWDTVRIRLEDFDEMEIKRQSNSEYTYFALPVLATGLYKLSYASKEENDAGFQPLGEISIGVKERAVWHPGTTSQNALLLLPDPAKPTFEQLFDGKVRFEIFSPETSVAISISLLGKNIDDAPLIKKDIATVALPRDAELVNEAILKAIEDPKLLEKFEVARFCRLNFESAELGCIPMDFRREFHPIQWEAKSDRTGKTILNLSDESFGDEKIEIHRYKFVTPDAPSELNFERYFPGYAVPDDGGLFVG